MQVRALQGETVDQICWRVFGRSGGVTEETYRLNTGLAAMGPLLPAGTLVTLPSTTIAPQTNQTLKLWD
jgi:phage tail protein X